MGDDTLDLKDMIEDQEARQRLANETGKTVPPYRPFSEITEEAKTDQRATRPMDRQEGGQHYKTYAIQPAEFCQRNRLTWCEANVVKYVCRHREKHGVEDIRKAIHYLEMLLEMEYSATPDEDTGE